MLGLINRATSVARNPSGSSEWDISTPLPSGFQKSVSKFELPLDRFSTLAFRSTGHWSKGTVLFEVEERAADPPGYEEARREKGEEEGGVCGVVVEARWNSESLWGESRVEVVEGEECGIAIMTPPGTSRSRLAAALSFHITFTLPALANLEGLIVSSTRFRILFAPSFTVSLTTVSLSTTDAPIRTSVPLHARNCFLSNKNDLDPDRTRLKNFEDSIHGAFVASHLLSLHTQNAAISGGPYTCTSGPLTVRSSNFALKGDFSSGGPMRISTANASISGSFTSEDAIEIATSYGRIEGTFRGPRGIELATSRAAITGEFEVGRRLKLVTSSFRIDAKVKLLPPPSSVVVRTLTPTPSVVDGVSPPTWEDVVREETEKDREVVVDIETTDAAIEVVYLSHPASVRLLSKARSSGGSRVAVTHPADYEGSFSASTTITSTASFDAPTPPSGLADHSPSRGRRVVDFSSKKRSEIAGTVHYEGSAREDRSLSRSEVRAVSGPAEIVLE